MQVNPNFEKHQKYEQRREIDMDNEGNKTPADLDWEQRTLCRDESCIGVIGPDGRCKECGLAFENEGLEEASAKPSAVEPKTLSKPWKTKKPNPRKIWSGSSARCVVTRAVSA